VNRLRTAARTQDGGAIVLGWLTKLAVTLGLLGLLAFDGIALATAHFSASDDAATAARTAAENYATSKDVNAALAAATQEVAAKGEKITKLSVNPANGAITLHLERTVTTLWMDRVGLDRYTTFTVDGEGNPPS
jgi:Flp pilus assembly protein TadG